MVKKKTPIGLVKLTVLVPDMHIPYEDKYAVSLVNKVIEALQPHEIRQKGDMIDCYKESDYNTDPDEGIGVRGECLGAREYWDAWEAMSGADLVWEEGNHENRWDRLRRKVKLSAHTVKTIMEIAFPDNPYPVRWISKKEQPTTMGSYLSLHGEVVRKYSGYSAKAHLHDYMQSVHHVHTHRAGLSAHTTKTGEVIWGWELGCLCNLEAEYITGHPNWQQGFGIHYQYKTHDELKFYPIHKIKKHYYTTVHGELYSI